jgi:DNA primase
MRAAGEHYSGRGWSDVTSRYRDDLVDRVRESNDILSVVSEYVQLKKVGGRHVGLCPFHAERTPSFTVSPDKQLFYCFGCHAGGNVFTFIMKLEGLTFREAVRRLGERVGIDVSASPETPGEREAREKRDRIHRLNELAMKYYRKVLLKSQAATVARDYLARRGVGPEAQEMFGIGYAPSGWRALITAMGRSGVPPQFLVEAGLAAVATAGPRERYYDRFRNRVIFPIVNVYGRVVGFGGRSLDDSVPKYLNSPESPVFNKRANLYGLNLAAERIRASQAAVLVEGYMDVVAAHQAGVGNVAATLGTALTAEQARLISRYAQRVVMCYDADSAGSAATGRGVGTTSGVGLEVSVAMLPEGHDPDSLIRNYGGDALEKAIELAVPYARYRIERILSSTDVSSLQSRLSAVEAVVAVVADVASEVERAEYVRELSGRLGVDPSALAVDVRKAAAGRGASRIRSGRRDAPSLSTQPEALAAPSDPVWGSKAYLEVERTLIRLAAASRANRSRILEEIGTDGFRVEANRVLFDMMSRRDREGRSVSHAELVDECPEQLRDYATELLSTGGVFDTDMEDLEETLMTWRHFWIQHRLGEIEPQVHEAEAAGNHERVRALMDEQKRLAEAVRGKRTLY